MTLDEAIEHAKEVAKRNRADYKNCPADRRDIEHQTCEECAKEHEQLAEWLEELKAIKSDGFTDDLLNMGFTKGYNKAIDDFVNDLKDYFVIPHDVRVIEMKAEQLKKKHTQLYFSCPRLEEKSEKSNTISKYDCDL